MARPTSEYVTQYDINEAVTRLYHSMEKELAGIRERIETVEEQNKSLRAELEDTQSALRELRMEVGEVRSRTY